ncbi:N-acetylmuramoyl-L-alanine amidase [Myxococcota bacterium]|nr:N-acetylmuramoyl-L-alanine amidase [Myxococcota bacterium]
MTRAGISTIWALAAWVLVSAPGAAVVDSSRFDTVVIDAGHGGGDSGALGLRGTQEKTLVLQIAQGMAERLREGGLQVVLTRRDDVFVPLERRFAIANDAGGDLFVSIHANASTDASAHGPEVYFYAAEATDESAKRVAKRENRALRGESPSEDATADPVLAILGDLKRTAFSEESVRFARIAEIELSRLRDVPSRGVKQAPFVVLNGLMPAVLVEVGFLSHPSDEQWMRSRSGQRQVVSALVKAVLAYGRAFEKKWQAQ